jgi:hypothetical protein
MNRNQRYGWRKRFSDKQTQLIKSVVIPMLGRLGKAADLDAVADELNRRLGPRPRPDEVWTAQRAHSFLTSTQRRVKRDGTRGAPGTVYIQSDDYWIVRKPSGGYEGIPKTESVIFYDGHGKPLPGPKVA